MNGLSLQQSRTFKSLLRFFIVIFLFLGSPGLLNAMVIDFDDLTATSGTFIPQGYKGFSWLGQSGTNSWVNNAAVSIDAAGAHTGTNYSWSNGGVQLDLTDGVFTVDSLWARNRIDVGPQNRTFQGWLGGTQLFSFSQQITNSWSQVTLNFSGIDRFSITSGANILIDTMSVKVPEPTTLAILAFGLFGIGFGRRKA